MLPQLGPMELIVIMVVGVLLFGKRLPEVGRSLGKGIIEFKKGLRGIEDEFEAATNVPAARAESYRSSDVVETSVPKFEPPTSAPVSRSEAPSPSPAAAPHD